jgi:methyl-accepting chemotaxis protein
VLASDSLIAERSRDIATPVTPQSEVTEGIARFCEKIAANGMLNTEDYLKCKQYYLEIDELLNSLDGLVNQFKLGSRN